MIQLLAHDLSYVSWLQKQERKSYKEITVTLGVNDPSEILFFVTDVYQEAKKIQVKKHKQNFLNLI